MRRVAEFGAFALLALGVHLAALAYGPRPAGDMARGAQGTSEITLQAVAGSDLATLEDWMRPPEASDTALDALREPDAAPDIPPDTPPDPVTQDTAPARPETRAASLQSPLTASLPQIDTRTYVPPPPPEPDPEPETEPRQKAQPRPDPQAKPQARPQAKPKSSAKPKAQKTPRKQGAAERQGQRASGSGGGNTAGANGKSNSAGLAPGAEKKLIAKWGGQVRARILRHKRFPAGARGSGTVRLRIVVARTGALVSAQVIRSSGTDAFDRAALAAVSAARGFPRAPGGLTRPNYTFTLNMRFG